LNDNKLTGLSLNWFTNHVLKVADLDFVTASSWNGRWHW